jgi:hypothetical protein
LVAEGGDGFFEGCGDVVSRVCDDVSGAGHVRLLSEPLADLARVGDGEAALSFDGHAALGPALGSGSAAAKVFADEPWAWRVILLFRFLLTCLLADFFEEFLHLRGTYQRNCNSRRPYRFK